MTQNNQKYINIWNDFKTEQGVKYFNYLQPYKTETMLCLHKYVERSLIDDYKKLLELFEKKLNFFQPFNKLYILNKNSINHC